MENDGSGDYPVEKLIEKLIFLIGRGEDILKIENKF